MTVSTRAHDAAPRLWPITLLVPLLAILAATSPAPGTTRATAQRTATADTLRDPALVVGTLPNGLRYYIRANAKSAGRAELRLVVNAGSLLEEDDQQGMAHLLEHMAFNGTTHFPQQSLVDFVETSGMRFGPDLNAYTSHDETVYMLTVPTDEPRFLTQGLTVVEDWASGGILIDSAEVVAERGVVLGEWRSRLPDTTSQKIQMHQRMVLFGSGARYLERMPIGLPALIKTAERGPIARFYKDWYRPDLMAVIVVGDVDVKAIEREIVARFGDIPAATDARPRPVSTLPVVGEPVVDVYRARVTPSVEVLWPVAPLPTEPQAIVERQLVEQLLLQSLDQRFLRMRGLSSRPFVVTNIERAMVVRPLDVVGFELIAWPDSLERGLATVLGEFERVAQHGIPEATLKRQKAALLAQLESEAASSTARPSKAHADAYTQHFLTGQGLLVSPEQTLAFARTILAGITPERVAEAARFWRSAEGRKVMVRLPEFTHVRPPTRQSVLAIFDSVANATLAPPEARTVANGPLLDAPPAPGRVVQETTHAAAGITEWTLSNGARVLFKPSGNDPDELRIKAWSPGGFSRVPDSLFYSTGRMVARMMTEAAGLGTHDRDDLTAKLATIGVRELAIDIGYGDESIAIGGSPRELETLFQMLYLQFTAPRLDSAALAGWQNYAKYQVRSYSIFNQLDQTFARGNPRLLPVSTNLAELADLNQAMAVYRSRFGNAGDFTFTIVGAATAEQVKPLVERYLATLPATSERESPKDPEVRPFLIRIRSNVTPFDIPKASTLLIFDGIFPSEPAEYLLERERLAMLTGVLSRRLRTRLREELSATYNVVVFDRTYPLPKEHYQVLFGFDAAPERMRAMNREMLAILDSVRANGATEAELSQIATIQRRLLETQLQDNDYWMQRIGLFDRLHIPLDRIVTPYSDASMTPEALSAAAKRYLPKDVYIHIIAMPEDSTSYPKSAVGSDHAAHH